MVAFWLWPIVESELEWTGRWWGYRRESMFGEMFGRGVSGFLSAVLWAAPHSLPAVMDYSLSEPEQQTAFLPYLSAAWSQQPAFHFKTWELK